ncbi:MAG: MmoB/DmpM family protein [Jatrophihabitans sp.]|uniref:MmoB/DmpM family protein n=1 Tax=Jatrophihabitans sp. TaxID=1932789 RepID=UPI003F7CDFDB
MTATVRDVGVHVQESGDDIRQIVAAIEQDNPQARVSYLPGIVTITAPGELVINRESVETRLGREWETYEFQLAIVSYIGHIRDWDDDRIVVSWDH